MNQERAPYPIVEANSFGAKPHKPYPGLRPFRPHEASIFRGREEETREILYRLGENNVVLVHGGSGCGKSSLVAAGLLPMLRHDMLLAGATLSYAIIRPSEGPLGALAEQLARRLGPYRDGPTQSATMDWANAIGWVASCIKTNERRHETQKLIDEINSRLDDKNIDLFCLVFDQFEEIFTWIDKNGPAEVEIVVNFLAQLTRTEPGKRFVVVMTMRSDFLSQCATVPELAHVINKCQYFIPIPEARQLRRAILEPAKMFGASVETSLVRRLITEALGTADALPVLQHALMRMAEPKLTGGAKTWEMSLADHRRVTAHKGNDVPPYFPGNALSVHAEEVRSQLNKEVGDCSAEIEAIFRALSGTDSGGRLVRYPTDLETLEKIAGGEKSKFDAIIDAYRAEGVNLLFCSKEQARERTIVDISHEALLRNWWRMSHGNKGRGPGWIKAEEEDALNWRTLARLAVTGETLTGRLLRNLSASFNGFARAPDRVRRYLVNDQRRPDVTEEPEWVAVERFIGDSVRREERKKALYTGLSGLALVLVLTGSVLLVARLISPEAGLLETAETERDDAQEAELAALEALAEETDRRRELFALTAEETISEKLNSGVALSEDERRIFSLLSPATGWIALRANGEVTIRNATTSQRLSSVSEVEAGVSYEIARPMNLRETLPDEQNKSKRISGLETGTPFVALSQPEKAPNGLDWLNIALPESGTVYFQYAKGDPAKMVAQIEAAGFRVPPPETREEAAGLNEVRYCRAQDRALARRVARAMRPRYEELPDIVSIASNPTCADAAANTIEIWVSDATVG